MLKLGIISIHYGYNFGSALQAYAMYKYFSELDGIETEIINYIPERYSFKKRYLESDKYSSIKKIIYLLLVAPHKILNDHIFNTFYKKYTNISPELYCIKEADERYSDYDILVAGSDQIWNTDYNNGIDPMYYLGFGNTKALRISYAASCGKENFTDSEWSNMRKYLDKFYSISLRETSAYDLFKKNGFEKVSCVLDPTFLLSPKTWRDFSTKPKKVLEKYVVIYCLDSDYENLIRIAKDIAEKKQLKVAIITYSHIWNRYDADLVYRNITPNEFVWIIDHAEYVVTNSFHGTAFSINLSKQLLVVKKEKYNSRIDSVLGLMNLKSRYIDNNAVFDEREDINYEVVQSIKEKYVAASKKYLQDILKDYI